MKTIYLTIALLLVFSLVEAQSNLSEDQKVFGLAKVWQEADKNFVFFDQVPDLNWDSTFQQFIPIVKNTVSDYQYYKELQRFYSLLKDGHTRVHVPWSLRKVYEVSAPIRTQLIDNKVIITEILNDTVQSQGIKLGMEITKINGQVPQKYAEKYIQPFVFYSTIQDRNVQVYERYLLKGHIDSLLKIETVIDGQTQNFQLSRKLTKNWGRQKTFEFKMLEGNIGLLKIARFWGDNFTQEFDSIYPYVKNSHALIIDVSNNEGGNSGLADYVLRNFVNKAYRTSRWKTPKYMPAYASWGQPLEWEDNKGYKVRPINVFKRYRKKVVVLISEKTYSAGEDFVSAFLSSGKGKVLGRPTAGTTGNPIGFRLLDSGFQVCSKRDYLASGKEFVGYGIKPDVYIKKTLNDTLLLAKALEFLKNN